MLPAALNSNQLNSIGHPVMTPGGLIVPERAYHDSELKKAVRDTIQNIQKRKRSSRNISQILEPWRTSLFSQYEAFTEPYGREKRTTPNFQQLDVVSYKCPLITACIVTQKHKIIALDEISHDPRRKGWRVAHKDFEDPEFDVSDEDNKIAQEIEDIIFTPDPTGIRDRLFAQILPKLLNDHMVFDRVCIEPRYNRKGQIVGYCHVDGTTIKPLIEPVLMQMKEEFYEIKTPKERNKKIIEILNSMESSAHVELYERDKAGKIMVDEMTGEPKLKRWVQVIDGQLLNSFSDNELIVGISNPSARINRYGYGVSLVEEATEGIVAWLTSFNLNRSLQSEGIVDGFLAAIGDFDEEVFEGWRDEIQHRVKGVANAGGIPMVGLPDMGTASHSDIKWITMRPTSKDSLFDYWLSFVTNLITSGIFQIHPSEIGMKELGTGGTALSEHGHQEGLDIKAVGHLSIMRFLKNQVFDQLVKMVALTRYNREDFRFFWVGTNQEMTRSEEIQYKAQKYENILSLNEIRKEDNLPPLHEADDFPDDPEFKDFIHKIGSVTKSLVQPVSQLLTQQAMMQGGEEEQGGFPGEEGEEGFGELPEAAPGEEELSPPEEETPEKPETPEEKPVEKSVGDKTTIIIRKSK